MKTNDRQTLATLAVATFVGITMLPSAALSSAASVGSIGTTADLPATSAGEAAAINRAATGRNSGNPGVVPIQAMVDGKSYGDWHAAWWQWTMSHPIEQFNDPTGQFFAADQSGSVWFLQGGNGDQERYNTMPAGTFLLCPLFSYINDYPCPDPDFQPAPGQSLEDFLTQGAKYVIDTFVVSPPSMEVDGVPINNPSAYRATSKLFTFTGDISNQGFDACVTGTPQQAVADGWLVILKPLTPGAHTLRFSGFGNIVIHLTVANTPAAGGTDAEAVSATGLSDVPHTTWGRVKGIYR